MLPDIRPGNTKILYFFNCLLDGMHTTALFGSVYFACGKSGFTNLSVQLFVLLYYVVLYIQ